MAPRLWLQGAEFTITGGSGSSKQAAIWAAFRLMRAWLQITALGRPVEPEVSRYLGRVVGPRPGRLAAALQQARAKACRRPAALREAITGRPARPGADRPSANSAASSV